MKKVSCFLMVLILVFSSVAGLAEEPFTLHGGVQFGMSVDEVQTIENEAGFELEDCTIISDDAQDVVEATQLAIDAISGMAGSRYSGVQFVFGDTKMVKFKYITGMIAGIEKSGIQFVFDKEGKAFAATYVFGNPFEYEQVDYDTVEEILTEKYGDSNEVLFPAVSKIGYEPLNFLLRLENEWGIERQNLPDYTSWAIQQENGNYVIITHYNATVKITSDLVFTFNIVGYQLYSEEELNKGISEVNDEANEIVEQRANDL